MTLEQTDALVAARDSNDKNRSTAITATFEEEKEKEGQAMRDYLSEYGNYEKRNWLLLRSMKSVLLQPPQKANGKHSRKN